MKQKSAPRGGAGGLMGRRLTRHGLTDESRLGRNPEEKKCLGGSDATSVRRERKGKQDVD